jgi:hypothetical protein
MTKQLYSGIESKIVGALTGTGPLLCVSVTLAEARKRHPLLRTTGARAFLNNPRITVNCYTIRLLPYLALFKSLYSEYTYITPR